MQIIKVDDDKLIKAAVQIADEVWRQHYKDIVPCAQIDYMLSNFQSFDAVSKQISEKNYEYYLMMSQDGVFEGYFAALEQDGKLFLSKIYIKKESRKKGYARKSLAFLKEIAKSRNLSQIYLTVNRANSGSIEAYKKLGFCLDGEINQDIGCGFFMNDYQMSLKVPLTSPPTVSLKA
ncbi:MAG: GNAT family N-acetyltransferase [Endomicrobium sp.]|nr:GNAT family N-acetyltransferase [Endomicrobium sp.]